VELAQRLARTGAYRDDPRSPDWFGYALAKQLGIKASHGNSNSPKDLAKLKSIIKTWKENNVLQVERRDDEKRKERAFIVPGSAAAAVRTRYADDDETLP
jgi:hypothetical protein